MHISFKQMIAPLALLLSLAGNTISASEPTPLAHTFKPGAVWLDNNGVAINAHGGGILEFGGTYYWFGEHKIEGKEGNFAHVGVHVYSSKDLYNWKDEGIALAVSKDPQSEITAGCILERPKVIYNAKAKKFVMWFHLEFKGNGYKTARSGVAVADQPAGPYQFVHSLRPNAGHLPAGLQEDEDPKTQTYRRDLAVGQMARDMTLFVDDDGSAYHIYASEENKTLQIARLTDDYQKHSGQYVRAFVNRSMEAPAICKRNGKYYLIASGCSGWKPNAARSAVAENIFGPWKELGNPAVGTNPQTGMGPELTFGAQSTYILPVAGKPDAFIAMFDIWRPENAIDGRYVWLPVDFTKDGFKVAWQDEWDLSRLGKSPSLPNEK